MRKKLMSYVLVAFLAVTLVGTAFAAKEEGTSSQTGSQSLLQEPGTRLITPGSEEKMVQQLVGRITAVFNYQAGILMSVMDQDRNFTVFDAGRVRATFGYNSNGTFTITSFNLYGTDLAAIDAAGGLENFLYKMGFSEKQLRYMPTETAADGSKTIKQEFFDEFLLNDDGSSKSDKEIQAMEDEMLAKMPKVAWLDGLYGHLLKGVNFSGSISTTGGYGATATFSMNGKSQYEYSYDGTKTKTYNYTNGFLTSVNETIYKTEEINQDKDKSGQGSANTKMVPATKVTYMDPYGRASYVTEEYKGVKSTVSLFSYSSNGAINSVKDLTTNATTFYKNGKQDFSINDKGFMTTKFNYTQNGSMDNVVTYNNGVATSMSVFEFGKQLLTVSLANNDKYTADELRTAYHEIVNMPANASIDAALRNRIESNNKVLKGKNYSNGVIKILDMIEKYHITDISIYTEHMYNDTLLTAIGLNASLEVEKMKEKVADAEASKSSAQKKIDSEHGGGSKYADLWGEYEERLDNIGKMDSNTQEEKDAIKKARESADKWLEEQDAGFRDYALQMTKIRDADTIINANSAVAPKEGTEAYKTAYKHPKTGKALSKQQEVALSINRALLMMRLCSNGYSAVASVSVAINESEKAIDSSTTYKGHDGRAMSSGEGSTVTDSAGLQSRKETGTYTRTTTMEKTKTMSFSITIMDHGGAAMSLLGAEWTLDKTTSTKTETGTFNYTYKWDPVAKGTNEGFTGKDGAALVDENGNAVKPEDMEAFMARIANDATLAAKVLEMNGGEMNLVLGDDTVINIMDGQGFTAVDGEEISVKVTDAAIIQALAASYGEGRNGDG